MFFQALVRRVHLLLPRRELRSLLHPIPIPPHFPTLSSILHRYIYRLHRNPWGNDVGCLRYHLSLYPSKKVLGCKSARELSRVGTPFQDLFTPWHRAGLHHMGYAYAGARETEAGDEGKSWTIDTVRIRAVVGIQSLSA